MSQKRNLKGIKRKNGVLYLTSKSLKGEELIRRLRGDKKKQLSKTAKAKRRAKSNRPIYRPDKPTGMTQ